MALFDIQCPACETDVFTVSKLKARLKVRCPNPGCRRQFTVITVRDRARGTTEVRGIFSPHDLKANGTPVETGTAMDSLPLLEVRAYVSSHEGYVRDYIEHLEGELATLQKYHAQRTRKAEDELAARRRLDAEAKAAADAAAKKVKVTDSTSDKDGGMSKDTMAYRGQALFMLRKWVDAGRLTSEQAKVLIVKSQTVTGLNELCDKLNIPRWE
jgi:hypothetical protein